MTAIIQRTENHEWLSNAYLVVDEARGHGVIIDANDALDPLCERVEREGIKVTHVLITHSHSDHIAGLADLAERVSAPVVAGEVAAAELPSGLVACTIADGERIRSGDMEIEALLTPGHAAGTRVPYWWHRLL